MEYRTNCVYVLQAYLHGTKHTICSLNVDRYAQRSRNISPYNVTIFTPTNADYEMLVTISLQEVVFSHWGINLNAYSKRKRLFDNTVKCGHKIVTHIMTFTLEQQH